MMTGFRWSKVATLLALTAIVAASAAQAVAWVYLVPIFQSPDEPAHLDYALTIHANKGLLLAQNTTFVTTPTDGHPHTQFLRDRSSLGAVAFRPGVKMPLDYGTPEFFAALDRDAPPRGSITVAPTCQLAALYPFGYYSLLAGWIQLVSYGNDGIVAMFFGARLFSVLLMSVSLILTYATTRLLHYKPAFCLLVTACIGAFPLTSFISSYVQPDNLSFTLVSLSFYLALRARSRGFGWANLSMLGTALGMLLVTKIHFWLCVTPAVVGMIVSQSIARPTPRQRWLGGAICLFAPSLLLGGVWAWTVWGTENYFAPREQSLDRATHFVRLLREAIGNYFAGSTHDSFWGIFGWLDTPLHFRSDRDTEVIFFLVQAASLLMLGLTLLRIEQVTSRLARVARAGRAKIAIRMAFSNPVINSYFLFTVFMLFLFVWTSNRFGAQGRNWFPMMLPIVLVGLSYAPGALTLRSSRRALSKMAAVGLLLFGVVGNYYARETIRERYYLARPNQPVHEVPYTTPPRSHHQMIWNDRVGDSFGDDPQLIFELDRPRFVSGIRIRFTLTNSENETGKFQMYWRNRGQTFSEHQRCVRYDMIPGEEQTLTVWIGSEISHFRIDPDNKPCRFELNDIIVIQEIDP